MLSYNESLYYSEAFRRPQASAGIGCPPARSAFFLTISYHSGRANTGNGSCCHGNCAWCHVKKAFWIRWPSCDQATHEARDQLWWPAIMCSSTPSFPYISKSAQKSIFSPYKTRKSWPKGMALIKDLFFSLQAASMSRQARVDLPELPKMCISGAAEEFIQKWLLLIKTEKFSILNWYPYYAATLGKLEICTYFLTL